MRVIATKGDMYGPSAGFSFSEASSMNSPATQGGASGDIQAGRVGVPITQVAQNLQGSLFAQPILWLFILIGALFVWKLIEESALGHEAVSEIKVGGGNAFKAGLMVMVVFAIAKYFARTISVPGISPFVLYATGAA